MVTFNQKKKKKEFLSFKELHAEILVDEMKIKLKVICVYIDIYEWKQYLWYKVRRIEE